jgi:hypothetical protein
MIKGKCPECDAAIQDTDELGGGMYTCPSCGHLVELPDAPDPGESGEPSESSPPDEQDEPDGSFARLEVLRACRSGPCGTRGEMPLGLKIGVGFWTTLGVLLLFAGLYGVCGGLSGIVWGATTEDPDMSSMLAVPLGMVVLVLSLLPIFFGVLRLLVTVGTVARQRNALATEKGWAMLMACLCTLLMIPTLGWPLLLLIILLFLWLRYLRSDAARKFFGDEKPVPLPCSQKQPVEAEGADLLNELVADSPPDRGSSEKAREHD